MQFVCRCGYRTKNLGAFLDHQASGHGDYRFVAAQRRQEVGETDRERAQVARAERIIAEQRALELADTTRATPRPVEPWEHEQPARARPQPAAPTPEQLAWTAADRERAKARIAERRARLTGS
jgi:hypothetical protein